MGGQYKVFVHDRAGIRLDELTSDAVVSWVLSGTGKAGFSMPKTDPKANKKNLRYGNLIYFQDSTAGDWGGVIWPPLTESRERVQFVAYSAEFLLKWRRGPRGQITGSPGAVFEELLARANAPEDTLIRPGVIDAKGSHDPRKMHSSSIYDSIVGMTTRYRREWDVTPHLDENNRLYFKANLYQAGHKGVELGYGLMEGKNLELAQGGALVEQGDIINDVFVYVEEDPFNKNWQGTRIDEESRAEYGLRQTSVSSSKEALAVGALTMGMLMRYAWPTRTYSLTAFEGTIAGVNDDTFKYLGLGNTVRLLLPNYGLSAEGWGTDTKVRIVGRELDPIARRMALALEEVA
jgi:hypothetical protein